MQEDFQASILYYLKVIASSMPLILSMFVLYYFGKHEVWIPETPHRDKMTILILVLGFSLSFFLHSFLNGWKKSK